MEKNNLTEIKNKDIIDILESQELLTDDICKDLVEAKDFIVSTYTDVPMYRPLPIKIFGVLADKNFPTPEAKFWQCKVEAEVHANELIRDIHDLELMNINLHKNIIIKEQMESKLESSGISDLDKRMIQLDIQEEKVNISKKRFEIKQVEKRIKYRISEVKEWKNISEKLKESSKDINSTNYINHYINKIKHDLIRKSKDEDLSEEKKAEIQSQLGMIDKTVSYFN